MVTASNSNEPVQRELTSLPGGSSPSGPKTEDASSRGLTLGMVVGTGAAAFVLVGLMTFGITHFAKAINSQERQTKQANETTPVQQVRWSDYVEPKTEMVEVIVAAKDLPAGTLMSKSELPKLITRKSVPKDNLPENIVHGEDELLDKRLSAPVPADGFIDPKSLVHEPVIILPEGKDVYSIQRSPHDRSFVGPGSHVDVIASMNIKDKLTAIPLVLDVQVLSVENDKSEGGKQEGAFYNRVVVKLAVTPEQASLLSMAERRGCDIQLLLRHPNKPIDPSYDMAKVKQLLEEDTKGK